MKRDKLTAEFFENAICKNKDMETKEYWSNVFKSNLKTILDETNDYDFEEIRDEVNSDYPMDYDTYQNYYGFICDLKDIQTLLRIFQMMLITLLSFPEVACLCI